MSEHFGMKNYMKGAMILTIAALAVKVLSAIYRVPFQNMVGDAGFYIYQQVYPFISIFVVWTSSGFAVAISKLLADADAAGAFYKRRQIKTFVFWYLTALSVLFFVALFVGSTFLANLMGDSALAPILRTGSFIVLVMPALAVVKGDFQSRGQLAPIAYAQVIEQFIRVCIILVGTWIIMSTTASLYAAGHMAILGTVLAEYFAFILLFIFYKKRQGTISRALQPTKVHKWTVIKEVTLLSVSVSMSGLLLTCYQLVDSFTVFSALVEQGMTTGQAMETKGIYDRGQPLVQLGIVIASSLSLAIVPLVAHLSKKENGRDAKPFIQLTYRTSLLFGVAASLGLVVVMPFVNQMLFETDKLTGVLMLYVVQIVPLSIVLTFTAILQGYGKLKIPAMLLMMGFVLKIIVNKSLVGSLGVLGAAIASNSGLFLTAIGLILYLKKVFHIQLAAGVFYRQLAGASIAMALAVVVWEQFIQLMVGEVDNRIASVWAGASSIAIGAFVMLTLIAKSRMLLEKEWFLLPFGRRMAVYQLWLNRKK